VPTEEGGIVRELESISDRGAAISSSTSAREIKEALGEVADLLQGQVLSFLVEIHISLRSCCAEHVY
jgi:hypothetical protein